MNSFDQSPVWPLRASDPAAATKLSVEDMMEVGGANALRLYLSGRFSAVAKRNLATPKQWAAFAVQHLCERVENQTDGGVEVGASAVQMALAYIMYLEQAVEGGACP